MATVNLGGYDPNTGWPPDDSTGVNWDPDVDIPGQFGRGGFYGAPRLTAPASGPPPGVSLSGPGGTPTNAAGMSPHIDPTTGQPEMLTGPGGVVEKTRGALNPFGFLGGSNPYWRGAITAGGVLSPTPTASNDTISPEMAGARPEYPHTPTPQNYPMWPTPPAPAAAPASYPHMPWPDTGAAPGVGSQAPAVLPPRPRVVRAAGPAAVRQQPNLGAYGGSPFTTVDRPNANPGIGGGMLGGGVNSPRGQGGAPVATALDLSRLFGGGQPAAAAPVRAPVAAPVNTVPATRGVASTSAAPWGYGPQQRGRRWNPKSNDYSP